MPRADLDIRFHRIEKLAAEMRQFVPGAIVESAEFRADLAGLLVVTMAATYESCVKETLITYAGEHHLIFGNYITNTYRRLNARIGLGQLSGYAKTFDDSVHNRFKKLLQRRKQKIETRVGRNIEAAYSQILDWRNDFAHTGNRNTTIEEAMATHMLAMEHARAVAKSLK